LVEFVEDHNSLYPEKWRSDCVPY